MKSRQVGFVLIALIILGIAAIGIRLFSTGTDQIVIKGLLPISQDVVDRVEIQSQQDAMEIVKIGDSGWRVDKYPAFEPRIQDFWTSVADIPKAQLVARLAKHHNLFGVDDDQSTVVSFYLGQSVQEQFHIGKWTAEVRLCYLRKAGKNEVYGIPCPREDLFSTDEDTWRNPIVTSIPSDSIESIDYIYPDSTQNFSLVKDASGNWIVKSAEEDAFANLRIINPLLQAIELIPATGFETDELAAKLDFDAPQASIRINTTTESNIPTTKLKFIRKDELSFYVRIPSQTTVYIVDGRLADFLLMSKEVIAEEN